MEILKEINMTCPCCMEKHSVKIVRVMENNVFKGVPVTFNAEYFFCEQTNETYEDEQQMSLNDIAMKNAYREKMGFHVSSP